MKVTSRVVTNVAVRKDLLKGGRWEYQFLN